jgi:biopolymer transport protein ExbB
MILDHIVLAGPVAWILIALSVVALTLLLERFWVHLRYPMANQKLLNDSKRLVNNNAFDAVDKLLNSQHHGMKAALQTLFINRQLDNEQRQQAASIWLQNEREYLNTRLKVVGLIGTLAPLLGLLGTVFGIINMFIAIAHNTGPVTPALLAEGMWTAMVTTALGLLIAIPSLAASHGFELLAQRRILAMQNALNEFNQVLLGEYDPSLDESVQNENLQALQTSGAA